MILSQLSIFIWKGFTRLKWPKTPDPMKLTFWIINWLPGKYSGAWNRVDSKNIEFTETLVLMPDNIYNTELLKFDPLISILQFFWWQNIMYDFLKLHWLTLIVTFLSVDSKIFPLSSAFERNVDFIGFIIKKGAFSTTQSFMTTFAFILLMNLNCGRMFWKILSVRVTSIWLALINSRATSAKSSTVWLIFKLTAFNVKLFVILKRAIKNLYLCKSNFIARTALRLELLERNVNSLSINNMSVNSYSYCCSRPPSTRITSKDFDIPTAYSTVLQGAVLDPHSAWSLPILFWVTCMFFAIVPKKKKINEQLGVFFALLIGAVEISS